MLYDNVISVKNILLSWDEFKKGKTKKIDVRRFETNLENNIFQLHCELRDQSYKRGDYKQFHICDPKHRTIHKATVKDRLVHHIVFEELCKIFESIFIYHSYSCRDDKGTHLAVKNLSYSLRKVSKNYTKPAYVLKCYIKKFFHNLSHQKLRRELNALSLDEKGLPIGNLTSQIFANIYMNNLDWFIKKQLRAKYYFRYADDFIIAHSSIDYLERIITTIENFLKRNLDLELHPQKIEIRKFTQGVDFLGYLILPHYTILGTKTKKRMFKKIRLNKRKLDQGLITEKSFSQSIQSYYGLLKHCCGYKLKLRIDEYIRNSRNFDIMAKCGITA